MNVLLNVVAYIFLSELFHRVRDQAKPCHQSEPAFMWLFEQHCTWTFPSHHALYRESNTVSHHWGFSLLPPPNNLWRRFNRWRWGGYSRNHGYEWTSHCSTQGENNNNKSRHNVVHAQHWLTSQPDCWVWVRFFTSFSWWSRTQERLPFGFILHRWPQTRLGHPTHNWDCLHVHFSRHSVQWVLCSFSVGHSGQVVHLRWCDRSHIHGCWKKRPQTVLSTHRSLLRPRQCRLWLTSRRSCFQDLVRDRNKHFALAESSSAHQVALLSRHVLLLAQPCVAHRLPLG